MVPLLALLVAGGTMGLGAEFGQVGQTDRSARVSVERLTLLPGPHFLSPAGSAAPGHRWRSVSSVVSSPARSASAGVIASTKIRMDEPTQTIGPLDVQMGKPAAALTFDALKLPKLETALRPTAPATQAE